MMEILKVVAYTNALEILDYLGENGARRFTDIENDLELNPNIVNMRLKDFRLVGLVEKNGDGRYALTSEGEKAKDIGLQLTEI